MWARHLWWVFTVCSTSRSASPPEDLRRVLQFIEDILEFETRVSPQPRISAVVCWGQGDVLLWRSLSAVGHLATLLDTSDDERLATAVQEAAGAAETRRAHLGGPPELFLIDLACPRTAFIINLADDLRLFADPYRWLLLDLTQNDTSQFDECAIEKKTALATVKDDDEEASYWEDKLGLRSALPDSRVLLARLRYEAQSPGRGMARLLELHRRGLLEPLQVAVVGGWRSGEGVCWHAHPVLSARRHDLRGLTLPSAMVVTYPDTLHHLTDFADKHIDTITKVDYVLVQTVAEMLNASINYTVMDTWGYDTNGSWSGMVGYLQRGQAEIGGTGLFFTTDRIPVIDYIAMTTPTGSAFIFRQPPLSYVSNLFTLPFGDAVWLASVGLLAVMVALLLVAARWEQTHAARYGEVTNATRLDARWSDVVLLTLGAVCQQGSPTESHRIPGRIISFMLFVLVMCLYTSYSANIVALLQSSTHSIRTLSDLLNSRLEVGVWDIVYNRHYFQVASDPVRRTLYRKKVAPPGQTAHFMELYEGFRRVRKGLFAFHAEFGTGYHIIQRTFLEHEKCGIQTIRFLQVIDPYLAIRKNSSYKELIKMGFRKMRERGVQSRTWRRLLTPKPECVGKGSSFVSVGITECHPALLVLGYGLAVAFATLLLELLIHRRVFHFSVKNGKKLFVHRTTGLFTRNNPIQGFTNNSHS